MNSEIMNRISFFNEKHNLIKIGNHIRRKMCPGKLWGKFVVGQNPCKPVERRRN